MGDCCFKLLKSADTIQILTTAEMQELFQQARIASLESMYDDDDDEDLHAITGHDIKELPSGFEQIVFAAGCFWCVEKRFMDLDGVHTTAAGYIGGSDEDPTYDQVASGDTGHAEAVRVVYEPGLLPALLKIFWECHDPTTLNAQGMDTGDMYRSGIWWFTKEQRDACKRSLRSYEACLEEAGHDDPIVTEINDGRDHPFYFAERHHQQRDAKPNVMPYDGLAPLGVELEE